MPKAFTAPARLTSAYYYTNVMEEQDYSHCSPLFQCLDYDSFAINTKWPPRNKQIRVIWILNLQGTCRYCLIKLIMYLILRDGVSCQPVEATQQKSARVTVLSVFWSQQRMVSYASRFLCGFERSFQGNYSKTSECWRVTANYKRWSI